jgi:hypothetical protein
MFTQVIFGGGFLSVLIWLLLFATSTAAVAISIKLFMAIRRGRFISDEFSEEVSKLCRQKDLNDAYTQCHERSDTFSMVISEIFKHYNNGKKTHEESAMGPKKGLYPRCIHLSSPLHHCRRTFPAWPSSIISATPLKNASKASTKP